MTRDDVISIAVEAGGVFIDPPCGDCYTFDVDDGTLERFAALAIENFLKQSGQYLTNDASREAAIAEAVADERKKHQADIESWKVEAATAEKWRGIACSKDGDGRTVQLIQQEAAAAEREACAKVCESEYSNIAERMYGYHCAATIRQRGAA